VGAQVTAATFTRDGSRVVIQPGRTRAREIMWARADAALPRWTADLADDGACIRYTLTATRVEPVDEYERPHLDIRIEAHEEGAQHHGPRAVIIVDEWRSMAVALDGYDVADLTEMATGTVSVNHRWVAALLRVSCPMTCVDAVTLFASNADQAIALFACPPLSLVTP
jgi:hypothetical protein